jgi:hypothetical protein
VLSFFLRTQSTPVQAKAADQPEPDGGHPVGAKARRQWNVTFKTDDLLLSSSTPPSDRLVVSDCDMAG